jgi:integrase
VQAKLTKSVVDEAKPGVKDRFIWDTTLKGFGLKVTPGGTKSYVFQYRIGGRAGRTQRVTIGKHGASYTPDKARQEAEYHAYAVKHRQIDPQSAKLAHRNDAVALAFDKYAERFITEYLPDNWVRFQKEGARLLRREVIPHFRTTPLPSITKRDVSALFDKLKPRVGIAKNCSTVLRKLFNWAVERGEIEASPMDRIALPKAPPSRSRFLDDNELKALWRVTLDIDHPYAELIRALILLGQRRDEVANMTWGEIDLQQRIWTIPGERTKNAKVHVVPLSSQAMAVLQSSPRRQGFVFSVSGSRPIANWTYWKRKINPLVEAGVTKDNHAKPSPWTVHDLRRSVGTGMQRLGEHLDVVEALANRQVREGVASIYQRHDYRTEMALAAQRWGDHIEALVGDRGIA